MNQASRRRAAVPAAVAAAVALLAGCAAGVTGAASAGSTTSSTTAISAVVSSTAVSSTEASSCPASAASGEDPTPEPAGDPVVMVMGETNAWEISTLWTQPVALAVYDGGGAVRPVTAGDTGATVPAMEWGRIDACRLDAALAELADLAAADFGEPGVTDQGTTTVTLRSAGSAEPQQIAVYALTVDPSLVDLTATQLDNRQRLVAAVADLQSAVTDPQPWTPNRVRLIGLGGTAPDDTAILTWPGPDPIETSLERTNPDCVTLTGQPAAAVLGDLGTGPSVATWTDGQRSVPFTATVLVPGQPGCPE